jgi:hypothetical protein
MLLQLPATSFALPAFQAVQLEAGSWKLEARKPESKKPDVDLRLSFAYSAVESVVTQPTGD